jgi:sarcosine oxidase subunit beta
MNSAEVIVIGAGIVGSSTAYFLAKAGLPVTLIDSRGPIGTGAASQASAGGVRHQARMPVEMPLALHAIRLWKTLGEELDADLEYRQDGMTIVTDEEPLIPRLEERVKQEQSLGLDIRMVYGKDLHALIPGLSPRVLAGSYCPVDGHANPMRSTSALASAAKRLGARIAWHCPARSFVIRKKQITAVRTAIGDIPCRHVVLAAGIWSKALAAAAGVDLPFHPFPLQMMVTSRQAHFLDQVLGWLGHGISLKQVPTGGYVIGGGWPGHGDLSSGSTRLMPGSMAKSARTTVDLFPSLSPLPVIRAWVGIEAFCVDEMQVLGPVPNIEGLFLAAGFSGHGFAIGPGVGYLIADYFVSGTLSGLFEPFTIHRFSAQKRKN